MDFLKRAFGGRSPVRTSSTAMSPNQTHSSPAPVSHKNYENLIVKVIPGNFDNTVQAVEKWPYFVSDASQVFADLSQVTPALPDRDRGLVLCASAARKSAPSIGPVLSVRPVQKTKGPSIQRRSATPIERAAACRTGGVRLPKSEPEKVRVNSEPEKLRGKSKFAKLCDKSQPFVASVPVPVSTTTQERDMMKAIQVLKEELAEQKKKFSVLYIHSRRLAYELQMKDEKLEQLRRGDSTQKILSEAQAQLAKSTAALHAKNKKTRFIVGAHKLVNKVTAPSKAVVKEMQSSSDRVFQQHRQEQKADVTRLAGIVDNLSLKYPKDRYSFQSIVISNPMQPGQAKEDDISITKVFSALCCIGFEPTAKELEEYDDLLAREARPDPIYSPSFPKPNIQWHTLNANYLRNMPKPEAYPIESCSLEPSFYSTIIPTYELLDGREFGAGRFAVTHKNPQFEKQNPFGMLYGFSTDAGVLPVPERPVHGYVCVPETGAWVIAARGG